MLKKFITILITIGIILTPCSLDFKNINYIQADATIVYWNSISGDQIWTSDGNPYIINSEGGGGREIYILPEATLTIKPGVIVKMGQDVSFRVIGSLITSGTASSKVIFTSIFDNIIENNCGVCDPPQAGNWQAIYAYDGGRVNLNHTIIRYGGFKQEYLDRNDNQLIVPNNAYAQSEEYGENVGAISVEGEVELTINYSLIASNTIGIEITEAWGAEKAPIVTVHNSQITNNTEAGIINNTEGNVDATNNWWGDEDGPTINTEYPRGDLIQGLVDYIPFLTSPCQQEPIGPDPVIIVPGIGACINLKVLIDLDPSSYDWQLMGHYYDGIIKTFEAADFELNKNLFIGCYDWRKTNGLDSDDDIVNSGEEYLKYWIDKAKSESETGATKVDIVAHSMGGLISRSYIQGDNYRDDVDQLIMLGTPNHGSSEAYYPWEGGEVPSYWGLVEKMILKIYLNILKIKGYNITNVATVQEFILSLKQLLPTYDYVFDEEIQQLIPAHLMVENNSWLRNLNQEAEINKLKDRVGVNIIYGNGEPTLNTIAVLPCTNLDIQLNRWIDGRPDPNITDYNPNGDRTVTANSAILNSIESYVMENIKHSQLPDQAGLKILELLEIDSGQVFYSPDIDDSLVIIVASPVFPMIIAPDNENKIGYDIETQSVINNISSAQYFSAGDQDVKLIIIPNPQTGEYKIELVGNGDGEYNLASGYFSGDKSIIKETAGEIIIDQEINYQINFQPENQEEPISDIELEEPVVITINSTIADIEKWVAKKSNKKVLIHRLKYLQNKLKSFDKQVERTEKLIKKIQNNEKLKSKVKQKILRQLNKRLERIISNRQKIIKRNLDWLERKLNKIKAKGGVNQQGYGIIISDINYLRENL
ncbi:hypothetical protein KAU19_00740 [Candidatus Parcubacteria bacterium]|nr:hypothetical protein [Candidatus Parcubacteria bacterium]